MNCHLQVGLKSAVLEPVRKSYQEGRSIEWTRVNDLPDYLYFAGIRVAHVAVDDRFVRSAAVRHPPFVRVVP